MGDAMGFLYGGEKFFSFFLSLKHYCLFHFNFNFFELNIFIRGGKFVNLL